MVTRALNAGVVLLWLTSIAALFIRDILPSWLAGQAPPVVSAQHLRYMRERSRQTGIFGPEGWRIGTNWVEFIPTHDLILVKSTTAIEGFRLLPPLRIESQVRLRTDGTLDQFILNVYGAPIPVRLRGENYESDFACELQMGEVVHRWRMDVETTRMLTQTFKPFTHLPHLRVGQSWQMRIVDPLAALTGGSARFEPMVARVTGTRDIHHRGEDIRCLVVEAPRLRALVAPTGEVLRHELTLPGLGRISGVDEPFDRAALQRVRARIPSYSQWKDGAGA